MKKFTMGIFFNPSDPDFMSKWEKIRKKGFRWFYMRRAAVIFLLVLVIFPGECMFDFDFPTSSEEWISVIVIFILVAAVLTLLLWKEYQIIYKYKRRKLRKKKRKYLHSKREIICVK